MANLNDIARNVLPGDMDKVAQIADNYGWGIEHDADSGLTFFRIVGGKGVGLADPYLLKMEFDYYPMMPPSAVFVHRETRQRGTVEEQRLFWPIFNKQPGILRINITEDSKVGGLYLCYPYTYEFAVTHGQSSHLWVPNKHSLLTTLTTLQDLMSGQGYGRYFG